MGIYIRNVVQFEVITRLVWSLFLFQGRAVRGRCQNVITLLPTG